MAPRFSRLASTINRDDIIAVIGASRSSLSELAAGGTAVFDLRFMADVCELSPNFGDGRAGQAAAVLG
jgi:hypothetical protein